MWSCPTKPTHNHLNHYIGDIVASLYLFFVLNLATLLLLIRGATDTERVKKYFIPELGFCFFVFVVTTIRNSQYKYKQFFSINGGPYINMSRFGRACLLILPYNTADFITNNRTRSPNLSRFDVILFDILQLIANIYLLPAFLCYYMYYKFKGAKFYDRT